MREERFSTRLGYVGPEKPISTREEASPGLRNLILETAYELEYQPSFIRKIVCRALDDVPDDNNWSEHPNIADEVRNLLFNCEWYYVYDIIEDIAFKILGVAGPTSSDDSEAFHKAVNDYFLRRGIGWKLENGRILFRGDDSFEFTLKNAEEALTVAGKPTAANEMKEAVLCLSRKPDPNVTGAIQHSLASLECISREVADDTKPTLGALIAKHRGLFPPPLDVLVDKAWGYSSEQGRHLKEGRNPSIEEAELVVGISAALSTYMVRKLPKSQPETSTPNEADDLPF